MCVCVRLLFCEILAFICYVLALRLLLRRSRCAALLRRPVIYTIWQLCSAMCACVCVTLPPPPPPKQLFLVMCVYCIFSLVSFLVARPHLLTQSFSIAQKQMLRFQLVRARVCVCVCVYIYTHTGARIYLFFMKRFDEFLLRFQIR